MTSATKILRVARAYRRAALVVMNTIAVLAGINVALWGVFAVKDAFVPVRFAPGSLRYPIERLRAAYPGWTDERRTRLLQETWTRPFVAAPFVNFREAPYRGEFVNVAEAGFREPGRHQAWSPTAGRQTVFVFGGSTVFGYGLPDAETIPAQLERSIARRGVSPMEVYNFGHGWYFSAQEQAVFERLLREGRRPAAAVFIEGLNEFEEQGQIGPFMPPVDAYADVPALPLLRTLRSIRDRLAAPPVEARRGEPRYDGEAADILDRWDRTRQSITAVARAFQIPVLFVWQPVPEYAYDTRHHLFYDGPHPLRTQGYELMQRRLSSGDMPHVLDLSRIQQDRSENLYVDSHHYTSAFSRDVADLVAQRLVDVLSEAPPASAAR